MTSRGVAEELMGQSAVEYLLHGDAQPLLDARMLSAEESLALLRSEIARIVPYLDRLGESMSLREVSDIYATSRTCSVAFDGPGFHFETTVVNPHNGISSCLVSLVGFTQGWIFVTTEGSLIALRYKDGVHRKYEFSLLDDAELLQTIASDLQDSATRSGQTAVPTFLEKLKHSLKRRSQAAVAEAEEVDAAMDEFAPSLTRLIGY